MHTQSLVKEVLYNYPVKVYLAGFVGDTVGLGNNGWEFSMVQKHDYYSADFVLQLALKHSGLQQYALSSPVKINFNSIESFVRGMERPDFCFNIQYVAPEIHTRTVILNKGFSLSDFIPTDVCPQLGELGSLRDVKFFKPANVELKDFIVQPEDVPQLLDMLLNAQKPLIKEIKQREQSRKNFDNLNNVKPAHQVQAQIISLAG